ncbi:uncharacterized protein VNE69_02037 [Vairimorpha necatrix]|uniref:Uncharacterized protein n=1 Tax=Vairimorpha necatrix TaxID=6039 RepID=A0AAX4J996_9MICR
MLQNILLSNTTASNTIDKIDQSNQLVEVQKFVGNLKCLNKENDINIKNEDYCKRINWFFSILDKWEAAGIEVPITSIDIQFGDIDDEKYKKKMKATCKWTAKYIKIYNYYIPKIKIEIENSLLQGECKYYILVQLYHISRAMEYFELIMPYNLNYKNNYKELIFKYNLIRYRLPYLFKYFDLCKRFIDLIEVIIEFYIQKLDNTSNITQILLEMSKEIFFIVNNCKKYYKNINEMTKLLETYEENIIE